MDDNIDWNDEGQRNEFIKNQVAAGIASEVSGLKNKNQELLGKLQQATTNSEQLASLQKTFESLGGEEGIKGLVEFKTKVASDERMAKLMSGEMSQIQEVIDAETTAMRGNYENQITSLTERAEAAESQSKGYLKKIHDGFLESDCNAAAVALECRPGTAAEIYRHAQQVFEWNEDHKQHVIMEDGVVKLGADGKSPMSPQEWLDSTRETASYRWPESVGGGAGGGGPAGSRGPVNTDGMDMSEYRKQRKAGKIT